MRSQAKVRTPKHKDPRRMKAIIANKHYSTNELKELASAAAVRHGFDPRVFRAQIWKESQYNPHAVSNAGAKGIAQIVPKWHPHVNPWRPAEALNYAAKIMGQYYRTFKNQGHDHRTSTRLALASYNYGEPRVNRMQHVPKYPQTQDYVKVIMERAGQ